MRNDPAILKGFGRFWRGTGVVALALCLGTGAYAQQEPQGAPPAQQQDQQICISVSDQGPGIAEQELSRVFEKYYRGAQTRDALPGIGMGLAIALEILAAHGGRIWAESSPGQGSRFSFTLPAAERGTPG